MRPPITSHCITPGRVGGQVVQLLLSVVALVGCVIVRVRHDEARRAQRVPHEPRP
jgi:hypothetical protein